LAGCSGEEPGKPTAPQSSVTPPMPLGTVAGRLLLVGGPSGTEPRPLSGSLQILGSNGSVLRAEIGKTGRFAIQLPPGSYRVTAHSPAYLAGKATCATEPAITVL